MSLLVGRRALAARSGERTIVDIADRQVVLPRITRRIILGDGPLAYVMALLQADEAFTGVVGWGDNFRSADLGGYEMYRCRFPDIDRIPTFRGAAVGAIDAELAISLAPDVVILNLSSRAAAESSGLMSYLARAGIAVVFIDFRTRMFDNTTRSISILAEILGREERAEAFLAFRQAHIDRVAHALEGITEKPTVMIERAAGLYDDCCLTYGDGNFGELVSTAGGWNLASRFLHGVFGTLHPEQVIASDPDVVLVTGANWSLYSPAGDWVNLGPGADLGAARQSLAQLMRRPAYRTLRAVKAGRVHAIWHPFYDNPYYFIALLQIAKWLHPDRLSGLEPEQVFRELHTRFLPVAYQRGYWVSLDSSL